MFSTFTVQRVYFSRDGKKGYWLGKIKRYIWNKSDCLFYNNEVDSEDFYMEVPRNGKKVLSLRVNTRCRLLVKCE